MDLVKIVVNSSEEVFNIVEWNDNTG